MKVTQIHDIVKSLRDQFLGTEEVTVVDSTNVVSTAKEILDRTDVDVVTKSLMDMVGKQVFVDRKWKVKVPSVYMDSWDYGSILEKIEASTPEFEVNKAWDLNDGQEYKTNIYHGTKAKARFFNNKTTFSLDASFAKRQIHSAFVSEGAMRGFFSMLETNIENAMSVALAELIMDTINTMIARTLINEFPDANYNAKSTIKAVNLLSLYNAKFATSLTPAKALTTPEFIRFAVMTLKLYIDRIGTPSTLFNIGGCKRQTLDDRLKVVLLSEFKTSAEVYLQSDTYHNQYTALPDADTVAYWQGSGKSYDFNSTSAIKVKLDKKTVEAGGILGIMFDREALGVSNIDRRVYSTFNESGEFYNNFYKADAGYFNDENENFVVFFIA